MRTKVIVASLVLGFAGSAFAAPSGHGQGQHGWNQFVQSLRGNDHNGIGKFFANLKEKVRGNGGGHSKVCR